MIRFKILKILGIHKQNVIEKMIPWQWISLLVELLFHVSAHPIGWANGEGNDSLHTDR